MVELQMETPCRARCEMEAKSKIFQVTGFEEYLKDDGISRKTILLFLQELFCCYFIKSNQKFQYTRIKTF